MTVKIRITPTTLFFDDMSDELLSAVGDFEVYPAPKGYRISSTPAKLYGLLVDLSATFDLEIY